MIHVGDCDICGKETVKIYWTRRYPELKFCHECFEDQIVLMEQEDHAIRISIALMLRRIRKDEGRQAAVQARNRLKGSGVPVNTRKRQRD